MFLRKFQHQSQAKNLLWKRFISCWQDVHTKRGLLCLVGWCTFNVPPSVFTRMYTHRCLLVKVDGVTMYTHRYLLLKVDGWYNVPPMVFYSKQQEIFKHRFYKISFLRLTIRFLDLVFIKNRCCVQCTPPHGIY